MHGILTTGEYSGNTLQDAHTKIQTDLLNSSQAIIYFEPSELVVSRAGDKCVVAETDQWYITYGHADTTSSVNDHINNTLNTYDNISHDILREASNWLNEWPCSRQVGLGTVLPVDERFVIDSLSDSTIYMAYYTISHLIEKIPINLISKELWSYIFLSHQMPQNIIDSSYMSPVLQMNKEFNYWYPLDIRISGKDLLRNHLVMALYNHIMVWNSPKMCPISYSTNGHLMLNGKKMSKSDGNFMTLRDAVDEYGTDAMRVGLALAGDGINDANFDKNNALEATLMLTNEKEWIQLICNNTPSLEEDTVDDNIWDKIFRNEVNASIQEITNEINSMNFRKGFVGIYRMLAARDKYRNLHQTGSLEISPKYYLECISFIEKFLAIMAPFCPLWVESIYDKINAYGFNKKWPIVTYCDKRYIWLYDAFNHFTSKINKSYSKKQKKNINRDEYTLEITVYTKRDPTEISILNKYTNMSNIEDMQCEFKRLMDITENKEKGILGMISKEMIKNISQYGYDWMNWNINEQLDEYNMIKDWIPVVFRNHNYKEIIVKKFEGDTYNFTKNGPNGNHSFVIKV